VGPRAGLDMEKINFLILSGLKHRSLGRPTPSQSLHRLRYPGSHVYGYISIYSNFIYPFTNKYIYLLRFVKLLLKRPAYLHKVNV
jgi:hypothetical protein